MLYFVTDPEYTKHAPDRDYKESALRVVSICDALEKAQLLTPVNSLKPRMATEEELLLCHTSRYIQKVQEETHCIKGLYTKSLSTGDTVISHNSYDIAKLAVGGALTGIDQIFSKPGSRVFCILRPPGHHASAARGAGFCIFNNAAIASRYAQKKYGIERVLIVDWDVHHGDGTQAIFYDDASVFYFSTHEEGNYPGTGKTEERGEGNILNVPIAPGNDSREKVLGAFQGPLLEQMTRFKPELVCISCGFDAHEKDPLGHFNLKDEDYFKLTGIVQQIAQKYAQGRIISILEGGYNLEAIATSSIQHAKALSQ